MAWKQITRAPLPTFWWEEAPPFRGHPCLQSNCPNVLFSLILKIWPFLLPHIFLWRHVFCWGIWRSSLKIASKWLKDEFIHKECCLVPWICKVALMRELQIRYFENPNHLKLIFVASKASEQLAFYLYWKILGKLGNRHRHKRNWNKELLVCFAPNISNSGPICA